MEKLSKNEIGITLIALIITIIVLLILAGITIGMLTSNNSILKQTGNARTETRKADETEKLQLAIMEAVAEAAQTPSGKITKEMIDNAIKNQFGEDKISGGNEEGPWFFEGNEHTYGIDKSGEISELNATIAKDIAGREYPLPKDATFVDGTVDTGLVISYKGSEFVWIPVNSDLEVLGKNGVSTGKKMARLYSLDTNTTDSKGKIKYEGVLYYYSDAETEVTSMEETDSGQSTTGYREPAYLDSSTSADASTYNTVGITEELLQEEYDEMIESVKKYGGFYVGRYESSLDGTVAASKSGVLPMSAATTEGNRWYGLYQKQKDFTTSSDLVVAGMIWGSQFDAMLNWVIGTETDKAKIMEYTNGNHSGSVVNCGSYDNGSDKINNIYDLGGNLYEWTKEAYYMFNRVIRGSNYFDEYPAGRYVTSPKDTYSYVGSRISLYIK